jgi:hypothetical protein
MLSPLDPKNKSLDNKEQTTYRRTKEKMNTENHKRGTEQLKRIVKQKGDREN